VRYDKLQYNVLFPPPANACVRILRHHVFSRPPPHTGCLRQQALRYRRAASYVANILAPPDSGLRHHESPEQSDSSPPPTSETGLSMPTTSQPTRPPLKHGLRAATFNALTLTDLYRLHKLFAFMDTRGIDILAIQETRCRDLAETSFAGYNVIHTPATEGGHYGCALITSPRCTILTSIVLVEHRAICADIRIHISKKQRLTLHAIAAYFPQRTDPQQDAFVKCIADHATQQTKLTVTLCDANGAEDYYSAATQHKSCAALAGNEKHTWTNRRGTAHQLDFVFISQEHKRYARAVSYEQPIASDHRLLCAHLVPKWTTHIPPAKTRLKLDDLAWNPKQRERFGSNFPPPDSEQALALYDAIRSVSGTYASTLPSQTKYWRSLSLKTENSLQTADESVAAKHVTDYFSVKNEVPWHAWLHIDAVRHHQAHVSGAVSVEHLTSHFKEQMEHRPPPEPPPRFHVPHADQICISEQPFTIQELRRALQTMKNHTSPGPDGIPIEAFRVKQVQQALLRTLNHAFLTTELPEELTRGLLTPIYKKKGDAKQPENYRPIVLLPVALKILHKLILHRTRDAIDPYLMPHQSAYRAGHSTLQNMITMAELAERARTSNTPLIAVFTDFSKAFDSINREHLFALLAAWRIPPKLINLLRKSHEQQRLYVRFDGEVSDTPISPSVGVMQGDTLAPYLFILVIDQILRQIPYDAGALADKIAGSRSASRIAALAYADDVILLANNSKDAQRLLSAFETAALSWGLHLNTKPGKTETMVIAHSSERNKVNATLTCSQGTVGTTTQYRYLGYNIRNDVPDSWSNDLNRRVPLAWSTIHKHSRLWTPLIPLSERKHFFQTLVMPVLTYAAACYPFSKRAQIRLHVECTRLLRHVLDAPVRYDDMSAHIHTEELYDQFPPAPVMQTVCLMRQWGHWVRHDVAKDHPLFHALIGTTPAIPRRGKSLPPSKTLELCMRLSPLELMLLPENRSQWKRIVATRAKAAAEDFVRDVLIPRRLGDGLVQWKDVIARWLKKLC
jgi:hypothetical protein